MFSAIVIKVYASLISNDKKGKLKSYLSLRLVKLIVC